MSKHSRRCSCGLYIGRCCAPACPAHDSDVPETRIVVCETCGGEGRDIRMGTVYELGCGHPHRGEVDRGPCGDCDGAGHVEVAA